MIRFYVTKKDNKNYVNKTLNLENLQKEIKGFADRALCGLFTTLIFRFAQSIMNYYTKSYVLTQPITVIRYIGHAILATFKSK